MEEKLIDTSTDNLLKAVDSVEFVIWERMVNISRAYAALCNVTTAKEALTSLGEMMLGARDLERQICKILDTWGCPPELVKDPTRFTDKNLDNIWNNAWHFYNRFCHAHDQIHKTKELTRLYYLLKDVAAVAEATPVDRYTNNVKRIKSAIEEF